MDFFNFQGVGKGQRVGPSPKHHEAKEVNQQVGVFLERERGSYLGLFSNVSDISVITVRSATCHCCSEATN